MIFEIQENFENEPQQVIMKVENVLNVLSKQVNPHYGAQWKKKYKIIINKFKKK